MVDGISLVRGQGFLIASLVLGSTYIDLEPGKVYAAWVKCIPDGYASQDDVYQAWDTCITD
jgi:hypothetical protein